MTFCVMRHVRKFCVLVTAVAAVLVPEHITDQVKSKDMGIVYEER